MAKSAQSNAAIHSDHPVPDPLDHWLAQEEEPWDLPQVAAESRQADQMPSGWWLAPALLFAIPLWMTLIWAIL